jgi:hypothetical protein
MSEESDIIGTAGSFILTGELVTLTNPDYGHSETLLFAPGGLYLPWRSFPTNLFDPTESGMDFIPKFIAENDPELPGRLRGNCLEMARKAKAEGVDISGGWDAMLAWAREEAASIERADPDTARDFLGFYFDLVAECRAIAT